MNKIQAFFKFLKEKRGEDYPLLYKFMFDHSLLTKEDLHQNRLELSDTAVKVLPKNLTVESFLYLCNTPIKYLPDNLTVNWSLDMEDSSLEDIPYNLKVKHNMYVSRTPLAGKYTKQEIEQMIKEKGGEVGEIKIENNHLQIFSHEY